MKNILKSNLTTWLAILLTLILLSGCQTIDAYQEIKNDPIVMDFEVHKSKDEVICSVIVESDVDLADPIIKADQFREVVGKVFKNATIIIEFVQDGKTIGAY